MSDPDEDERTEVGIEFDEGFEEQLDGHEALFDPVSGLECRVGGTWISGESAAFEVRAVGFFTDLLDCLSELYESEGRKRIRLFDDTFLVFDRTDDGVRVAHRYSAAAIDDPDELLGIESEGTTEMEALGAAAVTGAKDLLDRLRTAGIPEEEPKVRRLRSALRDLEDRLAD